MWDVRALPLHGADVRRLPFRAVVLAAPPEPGPQFLRGQFSVRAAADSFVCVSGGRKGLVWVNGFNLGRYWQTQGPQRTLYLPAPLLREGLNDLILLELDPSSPPAVHLMAVADLGAHPPLCT